MEEFRMAHCFRWKIILPPTKRLGIDSSEHTLYERDAERVWLAALNVKENSDERELLAEATEIVLRGSGYATEDEATTAAYRWRTVLELAFARRNTQADFGDRAPRGSGFFSAGIRMLEQQSGRRVLNDAHALIVFECDPPPLFAGTSAQVFVSVNATRLEQAVEAALTVEVVSPAVHSLSFDLYSASAFQPSTDARLIMLVMAVETLLDPKPRPESSRAHVEHLIGLTEATDLPDSERASLLGSMQWLRLQSIRQAGKTLAATVGNRTYMDMAPSKFFDHCYELRSRLVHGNPPLPERQEVDVSAAQLERFVAHLLSRELLDKVPD
jgi:hypothetical protein